MGCKGLRQIAEGLHQGIHRCSLSCRKYLHECQEYQPFHLLWRHLGGLGNGPCSSRCECKRHKLCNSRKTGGASTVTLTTAQMPSHTHAKGTLATANAGGHTHDLKNQKASWGTSGGNRVLIDATSGYTAVSNKTTTSAGSHSHTVSGSTAAAGSGSAHNNLQPYITCYMWKRTA